MAKPDYSSWLTKQQAADLIGVSTKTIEKLAQEKRLQMNYWKRPQTGARVVLYHPGDVERLHKERNPEADPFVVPESENGPKALMANGTKVPALSSGAAEQFVMALRTLGKRSEVRLAERLFLTVPEASEYSGLPQTHLRRLMKDGGLKALKTGGGWRIARVHLEQLAAVR